MAEKSGIWNISLGQAVNWFEGGQTEVLLGNNLELTYGTMSTVTIGSTQELWLGTSSEISLGPKLDVSLASAKMAIEETSKTPDKKTLDIPLFTAVLTSITKLLDIGTIIFVTLNAWYKTHSARLLGSRSVGAPTNDVIKAIDTLRKALLKTCTQAMSTETTFNNTRNSTNDQIGTRISDRDQTSRAREKAREDKQGENKQDQNK